MPVNPTSLRLQWGLPPESERNGIITQYVVECTGIASVQSPVVPNSPTFSTPPSLQQLLTRLAPFTNYSCRVAATNVNGTGPFSAWANATTLEACELLHHTNLMYSSLAGPYCVHAGADFLLCISPPVPGPVSAVSTSQVSDEVVRVSWSAPESVNGILRQYVLVYREYDSPSSDVEVSVSLPATSYNISGLSEQVLTACPLHAQYTCVYCLQCLMHVLYNTYAASLPMPSYL